MTNTRLNEIRQELANPNEKTDFAKLAKELAAALKVEKDCFDVFRPENNR